MKINRTTTAAQVQRTMEEAPPQPVRTEHERPQRAERIPFGQASLKLGATSIPGMHLHWINDWHPSMPDRIHQAQQAGYQFVSKEEVNTRKTLGGATSSSMGDQVSKIVGTRPDGEPITAYLMKIPMEWHLEHNRPVWDRADKIDNTIRKGMLEARADDNRYVPKGDPISLRSQLKQGDPNGESE